MNKLAIVTPNINIYSETFIKHHIDRLEFDKVVYFGGELPTASTDGVFFAESNSLRILRIINRVLIHKFLLSRHERAVINKLKKDKVNIVLAEYGTTGAKLTRICKYLNIPLVVHFHGYDSSNREVIEVYRKAYLKMFDYAKKVVSVSGLMTGELQRLGCPADKIFYNPYGPNEIFFSVQPSYNSSVFIAIGRFVEKKSPLSTIKAFEIVLHLHPNARLRMVGTGPLLEECKQYVAESGLSNSVNFLGVLSPEEIAKQMNQASVFVQHSVTASNGDCEGVPVAIIEASAAGLPIVSTYHAGIPDVVIHEETGFLCQEHDIETMAANMSRLLDNPSEAQKIGVKARERILDKFTLEKHINRLEELLQKSANSQV